MHTEGTEDHFPESWDLHPPPTSLWPTLPLLSSGGWAHFSLLNPFWKDQATAEVIHRGEAVVDLKNPTASTLCHSSVLGLSKRGFLVLSPPSHTLGEGFCVHFVSTLSRCAAWTPWDPCCVYICSAHSIPWGPSDFTHEREV